MFWLVCKAINNTVMNVDVILHYMKQWDGKWTILASPCMKNLTTLTTHLLNASQIHPAIFSVGMHWTTGCMHIQLRQLC